MLIPASVADGIAAGEITVQFRWWTRPTVKAGGQLRSRAGVLQIDAVDAIAPSRITVADAHAAGYDSKAHAIRDQAKYAQPDRRLYRIRFHRGGVDPRIALRDDTHLSPADLEASSAWTGQPRPVDPPDAHWARTAGATFRGVELRT